MSCVLTLRLDDVSQQHFENLRRQHFPPERNFIPAHLTLFHTLPEGESTSAILHSATTLQHAFFLHFSVPKSIGRGVAYFCESAEATHLHTILAKAFDETLSSQDRQNFRPHIVIQNKVDASTARSTLAALNTIEAPKQALAIGLDLWRYLGGPWQHLQTFSFQPN